jgi:hypothetical protein
MSQYSPPPPPPSSIGYATAHVPRPDPRPTSVRVISIIAIVFGSLGVLGGLCSLPQFFGMQLTPNPAMDAMRKDPVLLSVTVGAMVVNLLLSLVELLSGVSALKLRPGGRKGLVTFAWLDIGVIVLSTVLNLAVFGARTDKMIADVVRQNPNNPALAQAMAMGKTVGMVTPVIMVIWPSILLYFMTRPHVKAAFAQAGGEAAT